MPRCPTVSEKWRCATALTTSSLTFVARFTKPVLVERTQAKTQASSSPPKLKPSRLRSKHDVLSHLKDCEVPPFPIGDIFFEVLLHESPELRLQPLILDVHFADVRLNRQRSLAGDFGG